MKIIYRGGYNKHDPDSVNNSTIFEYTPIIDKLHSAGKEVAIVTLAKPDGYYNQLITPLLEKVDVIDTANVENTNWSKYSLILLMGGDTPTLQYWLKKGKFDLKLLKEDAVISGDSAGALVLCKYYYDGDIEKREISFHEGLNPQGDLITIVHTNNPHYAPLELFRLVKNFAIEKDLRVIQIKENQSFVLLPDNSLIEVNKDNLEQQVVS